MAHTEIDEIITRVHEAGVIRPRDLEAWDLPGTYLARMARRGQLQRVGRGLYMTVDAAPSEHWSLALAAKRVPKGVVCLLSALRFHDLTTQAPHQVWLAIGPKDRAPQLDGNSLRIVRISGEARAAGIETHRIDGVPVRIYGPAKTVADCFKFRNKIGIDLAVEALRNCFEERRCSIDDLSEYARICRVSRVIRPYLEAIM